MSAKEAKARIKINKLLEAAGWRFFDDENGSANIQVEANVKITKKQFDDFGENFEKVKNGFIDFLLLDEHGKPFIVLEAKSEDKDPLVGKEQARAYAKSNFVKYVILSNGNIHLLCGHTVVVHKAHCRKGRSNKDAHPRNCLGSHIGLQNKVQKHRNANSQ